MNPNEPRLPPQPADMSDLERLARGIIRAQGNQFIKELLRTKGLPIGSNKDDFERNLLRAIESGEIELADLRRWLDEVEGWGNQHVYLYGLTDDLASALTEDWVRERVNAEGLQQYWDAPTVLEFPEEPQLTSISFRNSVLRIVWQESSPSWSPVPEKDYREIEGLDVYEYRAFRMLEERAITRFEAHAELGLAALFIPKPIRGDEHKTAVAEARRVIGLLLDLEALEGDQFDISTVSRNMDQRNLPSNQRRVPAIKTQRSKLSSGGAWVEFAATSRDKAFWEEAAVRDVRLSIREGQISAFQGSGGTFIFQGAADASGRPRPLRVQLYGQGDRVRLWAQMGVDEVWTILQLIGTYR